jgi:multiple sugar transport system permease protein
VTKDCGVRRMAHAGLAAVTANTSQRRTAATLRILTSLAIAAIFALPLLLLLGAALRVPDAAPPRVFTWWPDAPTLAAFAEAFALVPLARALLNSLLLTLLATPVAVVIASWAGFALTQLPARPRRVAILLFVAAATMPYTAIWLPRFLLFEALGAVGTWWPLWAPALMGGSPLCVLLAYIAARRIPADRIDAARLEGLGWFGTWRQVVAPALARTHLALAVLAALLFWSNFIDPLLYLDGDAQPVAPAMLHALELLGPTQWPVLMAASLVVVLPVLMLVAFISLALPTAGRERSSS